MAFEFTHPFNTNFPFDVLTAVFETNNLYVTLVVTFGSSNTSIALFVIVVAYSVSYSADEYPLLSSVATFDNTVDVPFTILTTLKITFQLLS